MPLIDANEKAVASLCILLCKCLQMYLGETKPNVDCSCQGNEQIALKMLAFFSPHNHLKLYYHFNWHNIYMCIRNDLMLSLMYSSPCVANYFWGPVEYKLLCD